MHTTPSSAIHATGLRKAYGKKSVLEGVDIDVPYGTVFALLGPNGSGKTTVVHILSTLISADAGHASVDGNDLRRNADGVRSAIGLTGQFAAVDGLLTGEENLMLMARLRHLSTREAKRRVAELLDQFELTEAAKKPLSTYSGGMRRRIDLAMTLIGDPRIIFLDEPTTGLDPRSRHAMWTIIRGLVARGVTVFLTTQYLEEADQLADRIAVLDGGRIVAEGTAAELKKLVPGGRIRLEFADATTLASAETLLPEARRPEESDALELPSDGGIDSIRTVLDRLDAGAIEPTALSIHTPDLDDVFFALTGAPATGTTNSAATTTNSAATTDSADNTDLEGTAR
ncbi:ATP-binding cassette domain-containing protein [Lacisediminihabitans changchengi]|uniref:ATP-binding cassette domain-containing protein n=1 Tax=Lacisediminihabitans changchengi TaxID=2787634 RepID=UPI0027DCAE9F|nr:ATP-binding cassette domain-containing protein [Lacisediminihabitans changchengi]